MKTITANTQPELLKKLVSLKMPTTGFDFKRKNGKWSVTIN